MKKLVFLMVGMALVGVLAVQGFAWSGGHGRAKGGMGTCMEVAPENRVAFMKDTTEIRVAMETKRAELAALMAEEHPDQGRLEVVFQEMGRYKAAMALKAREHGLPGTGEGCPCTGIRHGRRGGASMQ
ncbi:hypothetical protein LZ24_02340 [Desulfobotulus alkaliphilus]|uniref:Heavy-metal resistance protein n=1 Tax=Desulfobotulus alkaliphilus TaxID=622671 RepID=A0A562RPL6_9BACT|nr:periplasmic heavy metal sensor [Desulfobotulus alkaliphilus]TWI70330.1 hypothetical protein LZ24_02340 [Desulfobotulus alkaliphilus]